MLLVYLTNTCRDIILHASGESWRYITILLMIMTNLLYTCMLTYACIYLLIITHIYTAYHTDKRNGRMNIIYPVSVNTTDYTVIMSGIRSVIIRNMWAVETCVTMH